MSVHETEKIKSLFKELGIKPTYLEHEPVITSEDAAKTRGFALKQGIKAIVLTNGNGTWFLVNLPADKKVDLRKAATAMGLTKKDIRMGTPEEVLEITGCEVGSVPPFGHKTTVKIFVDRGVYSNEESAFNIGLRTHSVKIQTKDMKTVFNHVNAVEGDFAKNTA